MPDFKEPMLHIRGLSSLYIENYRKLLCYSKQQIRILTKCGTMEINGTDLLIHFYSKEDIEIRGWIKTICFWE